jgi:hypothetical protein
MLHVGLVNDVASHATYETSFIARSKPTYSLFPHEFKNLHEYHINYQREDSTTF